MADKDYISKMIGAMSNNDGDAFTSAFDSVIRDKVSDELAVKGIDIHSNLLNFNNETDEIDTDANESVIAEKISTSNFSFKNPSTTKKFISAVQHAGGGKKGTAGPDIHTKGNSVSIGVSDKETLDVIKMLAKEFKGTMESLDFIDIIQSILQEGSKEINLSDNTSINIDNKTAESLARLHDSLNNDNQKIMREVIFETKDGYNDILELAKENQNGI
ncbi:MAG: hypothetical protein H8D80_01940 [Proteobacteria bacterium]|nr:hypothetical protein [Pseudomonadota bacterium]